MPDIIDPQRDNRGKYFVEDSSSEAEMVRQLIQDDTLTTGMGGPLPEQADASALRSVLDIGCGPGGWLLETARRYPHLEELVGVDISQRMVEYARAQAQARRLAARVEFREMDVREPLDFPDSSFDLVNMRFGFSFLLLQDWPRLLLELLRVTSPGGLLRLTEGTIGQSTSPAFNRINQMFLCAMVRSGHLPSEREGMTARLAPLLTEAGCLQVQTREHVLVLRAGTVGGQNFYNDMLFAMQTGKGFIQKYGCLSDDYDELYEQALVEMRQDDFYVNWALVTAWGTKPLAVPAA